MKKLTAVVLAAGVGSRFWPFTTNKVLFPFFGKTLFDFSVGEILPPEVTDVVIISNAENKSALQSIKLSKPTLMVLQPRPLGMADALLSARDYLKDTQLLILIADDITSPLSYREVVKRGLKGDVFGALPAITPAEHFPGGYLRVDGTRVLGIVEKPEAGNTPSPYVVTSGHFIADSNTFMAALAQTKSETDDVYERALTVLAMREKITYVPTDGSFVSLKYPWHVLDVMAALFQRNFTPHRGKHLDIKSNVIIEGDVFIGDNVKIYEHTKIVGPAFIGNNTIIGNNNIIRESYIGGNCVTGFSTDITRSYIGDSCWMHSNYIGDSVLEKNISLGAGAVLANLRLDDGEIFSTGRNKLGAFIGQNTRIGVHASIMPGIKIGSHTFIGSSTLVDRDIPENSFCSSNGSLVVIPNKHSGELPERSDFKKHL